MNQYLQAAIDFHNAGVSVVPAKNDGSKAPIGSWKQYQVTRPSLEQLADWFGTGHEGIGIITGAVSGNLEMAEAEGRAVASGFLETARELAFNSGLEELWNLLVNGYVERTPSGGIHILYRVSDEKLPGNTKLARRPGENGSVEVLAETRSEGGFVVVAPSSGATHPSGEAWLLLKGSAATIPTITMEERNAFLDVFRALDEMPQREILEKALVAKDEHSNKPGDDFNERATWKEILEPLGWKVVYKSNGVTYWRRPNKSQGISATTKDETGNLFVFSTSTTFEAERPYSKFAAYAHLHHAGDFSSAARELRANGYGGESITPLPTLQELAKPKLSVVPNLDSDTNIESSHIEPPQTRTSWYPKKLDTSGQREESEPEFLRRSDGHGLFYKGKINALLGESESGKTWVGLLAVKQALDIGKPVLYLDFEDSARGILDRLKALGLTDEQLELFVYANPDESLKIEQRQDLVDGLLEYKPELIIVDGINAAMTLLALDLNSNRDATFFSQTLLKPLALSGAAVVTIDHVTKSKDNRGNYAIGAQAKRADVTGAAYSVEVVMPFGRGMSGHLIMKVTKDRLGYVREISRDAKLVGDVYLRSDKDGAMKMVIEAASNRPDKLRPTHLMESVSRLLESAGVPLSKSAIGREIKGKTEWIFVACQMLIDEGYVKIENGARNSLNLKSIKPYREDGDPKAGIQPLEIDNEDAI